MKRLIIMYILPITFSLVLVFASMGIVNWVTEQDRLNNNKLESSVFADIYDLQVELNSLYVSVEEFNNQKSIVENHLNELNENLEQKQQEYDNLVQSLEDIERNIDSITEEIQTFEGDITNLCSQLSALEEEKNQIENDIENVRSDIIMIQTQIETITLDLFNIQLDIDSLNTNIGILDQNLQNLTSLLNDFSMCPSSTRINISFTSSPVLYKATCNGFVVAEANIQTVGTTGFLRITTAQTTNVLNDRIIDNYVKPGSTGACVLYVPIKKGQYCNVSVGNNATLSFLYFVPSEVAL